MRRGRCRGAALWGGCRGGWAARFRPGGRWRGGGVPPGCCGRPLRGGGGGCGVAAGGGGGCGEAGGGGAALRGRGGPAALGPGCGRDGVEGPRRGGDVVAEGEPVSDLGEGGLVEGFQLDDVGAHR